MPDSETVPDPLTPDTLEAAIPGAVAPDLDAPARHSCLINPPIVEASIEFRATLPKDFDLTKLQPLTKLISENYPSVAEQRNLQQQFHIKAFAPGLTPEVTAPSVKDLGVQMLKLHSADGRNVLFFRRNGMTLVRLAPYTSWDEIRTEALRIWTLFREAAQPTEVSQITIRYLNRIELPVQMGDFDDYLTVAPHAPRYLPDVMSNFFTRITVPVEDDLVVLISQNAEPDIAKQRMVLIVDLIATRQHSMDPNNDEALNAVFVRLRNAKNDAFFGSLKQRAMSLFS